MRSLISALPPVGGAVTKLLSRRTGRQAHGSPSRQPELQAERRAEVAEVRAASAARASGTRR